MLHVTGNLKAFLPDAAPGVPDIDHYAEFLRTMGEPLVPHNGVLYLTRAVLLISVVLHIWMVISLTAQNRRARPVRYVRQKYVQATTAARYMLGTGFLIAVFIVFHILHFTAGVLDPMRFVEGAVYENLYRAFQLWYFVMIYVFAMAVIAFHLYHGVWSLFQTLGIDNPDRNRALRAFAAASALALFLGFSSLPVTFYFKKLPPPVSRTEPLQGGPLEGGR